MGVPRGSVMRVTGALAIALGIALVFGPPASERIAQIQADALIERSMAADLAPASDRLPDSSQGPAGAEGSVDASEAAAAKRPKDGDAAYEYLADYNEKVTAGAAGPVNDPWGIGSDQEELADLGLANGIVGSVRIDRLGETMPLYLGASAESLSRGAGVVAGTSAPLGGAGANCVVAAHRAAWAGLPMLRDVEDMRAGDLVVVDTPWDRLAYRVAETRVIGPDDIEALSPQAGRDLLTLLTCHPYGHNDQRYLVYCERCGAEEEELAGTGAAKPAPSSLAPGGMARLVERLTAPSDSIELVVERWVRFAGALALSLLALVWAARRIRDRRDKASGKGRR
ncbi:MAG: class C sortase [Atopobiaceae bacterium]|nr:class C sortase [Atopobiaceae bacterium]